MPRSLRAALVVALVALAGATSASAGGPARTADAALDRALRGLARMTDGPPGVIAVVQRGSEVRAHAFGVAERGTKRRPRANDHMRIASVSKAFSGAIALALVGAGRLSLDDTIGERLPDLPRAWHAVTLRQALNHTSGIPNYLAAPEAQEAIGESLTRAPEPRELLDFVKDEPLVFTPGSKYEYSNSDNIVVGLMVEAVTGASYEDELARLVFGPLGLTRTSLPRGAELPRPFIHGYQLDPPNAPEDVSEVLAAGWPWASGGIVSTPADLNRFIRGYVGLRLFGAEVQAEQLDLVTGGRSDPPGPGVNAAGLGIFRYQTRCGTVYGHTGNIFGYTQLIAASADGTRSVTVSANAQLSEAVQPRVFKALRRAEVLAVCAALAG